MRIAVNVKPSKRVRVNVEQRAAERKEGANRRARLTFERRNNIRLRAIA